MAFQIRCFFRKKKRWEEERKNISHSVGNKLIPAKTIHGNHSIAVCIVFML